MNNRLFEIASLANFIIDEYSDDGYLNIDEITKAYKISYSYGNYKNCFDGLLEYDSKSFHVYINLDRLEHKDNPRSRFTFAHELGHFFIDEHRNAMIDGKSLYHASFNKIDQIYFVEKEADTFASNVLMPDKWFKEICFSNKFSFSLIEKLTQKFHTSLTATLLRFINIGNHPIMVVISQKGVMKHIWRSEEFPYKYVLNFDSKKVPVRTVVGDYFYHNQKIEEVETVFANEWFQSYADISDIKLFEKCVFSEKYNMVISIIWEY